MSLSIAQSAIKTNLYELGIDQLADDLSEFGYPLFRARQIWQWLYRHYVDDFNEMTNLPLPLRQQLATMFTLRSSTIVSSQQSIDGQTTKVLFRLDDNQLVETVLMKYRKRRTLCISTQAGCAMGCVFCATGQMGFFRNLSVPEIISQVLHFARQLGKENQKVTNIVLMGGFNLGARKITISTVGLVPAIRRYADEQRQTALAISLHAATDEERNKLIPINKKWPIAELMDACRYYIRRTNRRLTFEWALINRENDTLEQAQALGRLLQGMLCHVNLIPLNPTDGYGGAPSERDRVTAFQGELKRFGISSTVRVRRGIDIQAGCGQLRDRYSREQ
jgi:23S rRNA (adenine2503-C2)-methyltransferase